VPVISIRKAQLSSNRDGRHKAGYDVVNVIPDRSVSEGEGIH